ncbi:AAA family ATPase [Neolewinella antarctica]|uniref:MoxR-like ATPase n=1 Tax=Neolewinella antarctica TaxID=442734 RepID=A0ABX0XD21_9BACT|nr:AAA family ATPase [Neolewinella antarctica]NJC27102.1 MoxR-like ATPase [Neolewinella antarctica]
MNKPVDKLNEVLTFVKNTFVGKDDVIDLLGICLVAGENAFLLGPPGTAKSAIVRLLSSCIENGKNFEYLLTRFTEPSEIFGPFDIRKLKEGDLVTNTEGMLPEASVVFLDEIFNANSAILNSLLTALNEKIFRRGKQLIQLPVLAFVGASNLLPEEETLEALLDRFLIRIKCDNVDPQDLEKVLLAGWQLDGRKVTAEKPSLTPGEIKEMQAAARAVDLSAIRGDYLNLVHGMRNAGVKVSDRRAVKFQYLIAASAHVAGRGHAVISDLWVLQHTWDTEEQIDILAGMVSTVIENDPEEKQHPQAKARRQPDAEQLLRELADLRNKWTNENTSLEERNVIKDKLRYVQTRGKWVRNPEHKKVLTEKADALWQTMLETT